jgi:hypothetical protein
VHEAPASVSLRLWALFPLQRSRFRLGEAVWAA